MKRVADLKPGTFFKFPNGSYRAMLVELEKGRKQGVYLHSGKQACVNDNTLVVPVNAYVMGG